MEFKNQIDWLIQILRKIVIITTFFLLALSFANWNELNNLLKTFVIIATIAVVTSLLFYRMWKKKNNKIMKNLSGIITIFLLPFIAKLFDTVDAYERN